MTKKEIPSFWWDLETPNKVIVESNDDDHPIVAEFYYDPDKEGRALTKHEKRVYREIFGETFDRVGQAESAIKRANMLIKDLNEGREDYRKLSKNVNQQRNS